MSPKPNRPKATRSKATNSQPTNSQPTNSQPAHSQTSSQDTTPGSLINVLVDVQTTVQAKVQTTVQATVQTKVQTWIPKNRFLPISETIIEHQNPEHTAIDANAIKVLNWNIAKQNHEQDWLQDFRRILQQQQPNLICLQEVRMCQMTRQAIALLHDMSWSFAPNFIDAHHKIYAGVLIAARALPLQRRSLFSLHHEPISKTPKVSLIKEYPLVGQSETLLVINSHLINFVTLDKFKAQLRGIEDKISHHRGLVIFAGDFNTWNEARASAMQTMMTRLGLIQVRFSAQDTQNLKRFLFSPPLDYIFYRGLTPKKFSARVLNDFCSSDHKPMLVEFGIGRF